MGRQVQDFSGSDAHICRCVQRQRIVFHFNDASDFTTLVKSRQRSRIATKDRGQTLRGSIPFSTIAANFVVFDCCRTLRQPYKDAAEHIVAIAKGQTATVRLAQRSDSYRFDRTKARQPPPYITGHIVLQLFHVRQPQDCTLDPAQVPAKWSVMARATRQEGCDICTSDQTGGVPRTRATRREGLTRRTIGR